MSGERVGVRVKLQRIAIGYVTMDSVVVPEVAGPDGKIDVGQAAAQAMEYIIAGGEPDGGWQLTPIGPTSIRAVSYEEVEPDRSHGQAALTNDPEIPPDGLDVPSEVFGDDVPIPLDGLEVTEDDGEPVIPADGLPISDIEAGDAIAATDDDDDDDGGVLVEG
jgi:hypothetical protein